MKVTLRNHAQTYAGIDSVTGRGTFTVDDLTPSFSDDGKFLIMTKILGGTDCTEAVVDGVTVCTAVAEQITLECKYPLDDQNLDDSFTVSGQDTTAQAENTGNLVYNLEVDDNKLIGEEIKFRINPVNANLVYATVNECHVKRGGQELTIIGHGTPHCTNPVVGAKTYTSFFSSQGQIEGSWNAFKWSTAQNDNVEDQTLSCKIGLSQAKSTVAVDDCTASNA